MFGSPAALVLFFFVHLTALFAAGHALCFKRDPRSAAAWLILIVFVPLLGTLLYFWVGINRVRRRARGLRRVRAVGQSAELATGGPGHPTIALSGRLNRRPLTYGNELRLLVNGEEAYPAMLAAIRQAKKTITLASYIFDNDSVGREFAVALVEAGARGVRVHVLVDAVGARYSFPSIFRELRGENVEAVRFLDTVFPWRFHYSQLRNHRKILVVDGKVAFMGGMNIRQAHLVASAGASATRDLHFEVRGPAVNELQRVFAEDWEFAAGKKLQGEAYFSATPPTATGSAARVVTDGPDEDFEKLRWTILGALGAARSSVRILTPYFVPDPTLIQMLGLTALRGVNVEIVIPERNNVLLVQWAAQALLWQVVERGCKVYLSPGPFDHSKLFVVDDEWALVGSANWDARSLRLNFELELEVADARFVGRLSEEFAKKRSVSRPITLAEVDSRSLPVRLRDGAARLFSPYL